MTQSSLAPEARVTKVMFPDRFSSHWPHFHSCVQPFTLNQLGLPQSWHGLATSILDNLGRSTLWTLLRSQTTSLQTWISFSKPATILRKQCRAMVPLLFLPLWSRSHRPLGMPPLPLVPSLNPLCSPFCPASLPQSCPSLRRMISY